MSNLPEQCRVQATSRITTAVGVICHVRHGLYESGSGLNSEQTHRYDRYTFILLRKGPVFPFTLNRFVHRNHPLVGKHISPDACTVSQLILDSIDYLWIFMQ